MRQWSHDIGSGIKSHTCDDQNWSTTHPSQKQYQQKTNRHKMLEDTPTTKYQKVELT